MDHTRLLKLVVTQFLKFTVHVLCLDLGNINFPDQFFSVSQFFTYVINTHPFRFYGEEKYVVIRDVW